MADEQPRIVKVKVGFAQQCRRCGAVHRLLESHHRRFKKEGGSDKPQNRRWLCEQCHDYIHARANIVEAIRAEKGRLAVLEKRLTILDELNTPEKLKVGEYQSYFDLFREPLPQPKKPANLCVRGIGPHAYELTYESSGTEAT